MENGGALDWLVIGGAMGLAAWMVWDALVSPALRALFRKALRARQDRREFMRWVKWCERQKVTISLGVIHDSLHRPGGLLHYNPLEQDA